MNKYITGTNSTLDEMNQSGEAVTFNGHRFEDYGISTTSEATYGAPKRDITEQEVPGRNGTLLFDNGRYKNITVTYDCTILQDFEQNAEKLRNDLLSSPGYHKLTDHRHPGEYRMAEYRGAFSPTVYPGRKYDTGKVKLSFNCKPQRFLNSGDESYDIPVVLIYDNDIAYYSPFEVPLDAQHIEIGVPEDNIITTLSVKLWSPDYADSYTMTLTRTGNIYKAASPASETADLNLLRSHGRVYANMIITLNTSIYNQPVLSYVRYGSFQCQFRQTVALLPIINNPTRQTTRPVIDMYVPCNVSAEGQFIDFHFFPFFQIYSYAIGEMVSCRIGTYAEQQGSALIIQDIPTEIINKIVAKGTQGGSYIAHFQIDCENYDATLEGYDFNSHFYGDFPALGPGETYITRLNAPSWEANNLSYLNQFRICITPHWWEL